MFETLRNAFKIKDVRNKILFTLFMLVVVRLGSQLPVPGIDRSFFSDWFAKQQQAAGGAFNFFSAFTGGSFEKMSIFALNITPYITSSIIIQLLTIAIPKLEEMQKDGEDGRKKITAITRYVTVALALIESIAMAIGFGNQGLIPVMRQADAGFIAQASAVLVVVVALTAGSAFLMWVGERITEKGVGNGISIVLMINILSRVPSDLTSLFNDFVKGKTVAKGALAALIILAVVVVTVILVILLNDAQRKIPVQYAKKMQGRKMVGGQSTHIPLKVNTAGVIPVIFASSLMSMPSIIATFMGKTGGTGVGATILGMTSQQNWFKPSAPIYTVGFVVYAVLIIFFAYFYTSITFNPIEVADNMKKQGGFIPGIRPGKPTTDYLNKILNYIIFIGAIGLLIVCTIPIVANGVFGAYVSFGGTSIIIIVGVVLETLKQIESQMLVRNYRGFLSD
ncbi:preprotein translocase subunit SecY [Murimonas intestini]|uniref:Protein translocase subunit SecY n=1 Tax=Murimonas intestini TaxID=1337051 RepID=A0AB73T900_9FIRM|nr:preprotein translocase subunit SecY [Murimonas intestini]MCR1839990.1 preprotein translocase subunit SecY [Murimonas intestini]MCR1866828.1 preprotein translocase subunit SecY [Murimonas intestini]MCR1883661.1 preprotein translocase subunit SecY [Murimonas intestini]